MSRTYEALKKAEAEKGRRSPNGDISSIPVDGHQTPEIHWETDVPSQVEYEKIKVWLANSAARGQRPQTVMVVSCRAGTGSTTTAALLATTLAESKKSRVLIIDSNFRTPSLNFVFKVKNNGGFMETANEGIPFETHIQPTNRQNLFVMTSGQISNSLLTGAFEGDAIDNLISHLKQQFDFIIFDAAPASEFADCYALASKVDRIIMVVRAEKTSVEEAQRAKRDLEAAGGQILGVVLNDQKDYTPPFLKKFFSISG